jgi:hypothetical protein
MKPDQSNLIHLKLSLLDKEEIRRNVLNSSLPDVITKLHLEIPPTKSFGYYYSFNGISEILSNMLKMDTNSDKHDLRNGDVYLKVYYKKKSIYTLPVLSIDIFFFKELSSQTTDFLKLKIKTDLLVFTNGGGNIEFIRSLNLESVYDLLKIPRCFLLVLNNEILTEYSISQKVKDEMESVLLGLVPIMKLDVRNLLEEPDYSVFVNYKNKIDERRTLLYNYL